ncbi:MAG: hypothetical protein K0U98_06225 [Deltaproteobacteria bacterium]|nr:hypothetical protein [Deltaproteobacteria bacterium]
MSESKSLQGQWAYRSLYNDPDLGKPFNALRFGQGTLELEPSGTGELTGSLGDTKWRLDLIGNYALGNPLSLRFQGKGEIKDELWVYDYMGWLVPRWPNGVDQRPAIVGSVIRTVPHSGGSSPAGYVGSFYAVLMS